MIYRIFITRCFYFIIFLLLSNCAKYKGHVLDNPLTWILSILPDPVAFTFSPSGGAYSKSQKIYLQVNDSDTKIFYSVSNQPFKEYNGEPIDLNPNTEKTIIQAYSKANKWFREITSPTYSQEYRIVPKIESLSVDYPSINTNIGIKIKLDRIGKVKILKDTEDCKTTTATETDLAENVETTLNYLKSNLNPSSDTNIKVCVKDTISGEYAIGSLTIPRVVTPTFNVVAGTYNTDQSITLTSTTSGATIYYTTNGTTPTTSSTIYSSPILVSGHGTTLTIKAIAIKNGIVESEELGGTFVIDYYTVATPTISLASGTYNVDKTVTLSITTSGASIYYTLDGSNPTTSSTLYTAPISISGHGTNKTIKAIGIKSQMNNSQVASASYTITYDPVATPTFSLSGGTYSSDQTVTISTSTDGAAIYYTTDSSTPTTSSTQYSSAISIAVHGTVKTIKAIAVKTMMLNSTVASGTYTINYTQVSTPTFSPSGGTYSSDQTVTISTSTSGASIYYTLDGSTPTTSSTQYSSAISVTGNGTVKTIKAIAVKTMMLNSTVASATYTITYLAVATPTFSPSGGTYSSDQTVTISTSTSGSTIYYTLDGSTPTTSSAQYTSAISIAGHGTIKTVKAIAVKTMMLNSSVATSGTFSINYILFNGLVGYYPFSNDVLDKSGNCYHGTNTGSTLTNDRFGNANSAYSFDGVDDKIDSNLTLTNLTAKSYSVWFKTGTGGTIIQDRGPANINPTSRSLNLYIDKTNGKVQCGIHGDNVQLGVYTNASYNDNTWHHAVCMWSAPSGQALSYTQSTLYIDGVQVTSFSNDNTNSNPNGNISPISGYETHKIGFYQAWYPSPNSIYSGMIDDLRIYTRTLTPSEITTLYNESNPNTVVYKKSCKEIYDSNQSMGNGVYRIDPDGAGSQTPISVYCDMTTDGGGWTLGFIKNSKHSGSYGNFGSGYVTTESLSNSPTCSSSSAQGIAGWLDLNQFSYTNLKLASYSSGTQTYISQSIPKSELRIQFGQNGYLLYGNTTPPYFWCGGIRNYTDNGEFNPSLQINKPATAPYDCKWHGGLGSGWDFSTSNSANQGLTLCGGDDGQAWMYPSYGSGGMFYYGSAGVAYSIWVK